jgi:Holliday junction DNA helicase RuvB
LSRRGLDSIIGLVAEKQKAEYDIGACKHSGEVFPHTLLEGVGGTGKTSLVRAIGEELNYHFVEVEASAMRSRKSITDRLVAAVDQAKSQHRVLLFFVDECHRLSLTLQETFYYPMDRENPRITTDKGEIKFPKFCLMAATTRRDMLDEASFVRRFGNVWHINRYEPHWLQAIVLDWFDKKRMRISPTEAFTIAERSLGIPRQAIALSMRVRNIALYHKRSEVLPGDCDLAFRLEKIDHLGLTEVHVKYLKALQSAEGMPMGVKAVAGKLGQNPEVVEGNIEPILLSLDLIDLTPRGRIITAAGREHLA